MQCLKERIMSKKQNFYTYRKNVDFVTLKAKNTCHYFKIFFIISPLNSIPDGFQPQFINNMSEGERMIIQANILNKNESYFNESTEEIEFSEKYYEIYSLAELKNNIKGFEWFTKLNEFKEAFINGINNDKYEFLLIKNVLLLSINIINIFGINKNAFLILRPYINNINTFSLRNENTIYINKNKENNNLANIINEYKINIKNNNNDNNKTKKNNTLVSVVVNNKKKSVKEFLDKKRLKSKKNITKKLSERNNNTPTNNSLDSENSPNKTNKDNIYSINYMVDAFVTDLKNIMKNKFNEFEIDGLSKYSIIIKNDEEESIIGDMISVLKLKKYRLLYKATRDGDSANKFHSMCDNYNNLIILIETTEGLRFGGFTSSKFKGSAHMKKDNNAFLFSLDLKKVYKIIPEEYAIYCYPNSGPSFSKGSLYVPDNFFKKFGKIGSKGGPYQFETDYELNNGKKQFIVKELEIFQVKIGEN